MTGTEVTIIRRTQTGSDDFNMPVYEETTETVENCLVCPVSTDVLDENRPEGFELIYRVVFPSTFTGSLAHTQLILPLVDEEQRFDVYGDPQPVPHNCPTQWNRTAEVGHVQG